MSQECWIAVDTANTVGSVAVFAESKAISEVRFLEGTASEVLMRTLQELLTEHALPLQSVTHLACNHGPGGFTGLRVGASVMQGLSWGLKKPLWGACALEATAEVYHRHCSHASKTKVWVVQDARLGQVFWGQYEWSGEHWHCYQPPQLSYPESMVIPSSSEWVGLGSGWGIYPELQDRYQDFLAEVHFSVSSDAGAVLSVARRWAASGVAGLIGRIELNYLRNKVAQTVEERAAIKELNKN